MIHTITVSHMISMGHRLPTYDGIYASLHGHNVTFDVTATSFSFIDSKAMDAKLQTLLRDFDHALVLWEEDPWLDVFLMVRHLADPSRTTGKIREGLDGAFAALRLVRLSVEPTTEALAQYIFNAMYDDTEVAQDYTITIEEVVVHETEDCSATCRQKDSTVWRVA